MKKFEIVHKSTNKVIATVECNSVACCIATMFSSCSPCFVREVEVKDEPKKKYVLNITLRDKSLESEEFPPIVTNSFTFDTFEEAKTKLLERYTLFQALSILTDTDVKCTEFDEARGNLIMSRGINCTDGTFFVGSIVEM